MNCHKFVLATHNKDKLREFRNFFSGFDIEFLTLDDLEIGEIAETGDTLRENALQKAEYVYNILHLPVISDDTGLEIDYLNGEPGVYSARFAGEQCSYDDNVNKVLTLMNDVKLDKRGAKFRTVICLYVAAKEYYFLEGVCEGIILDEKRGQNGFGYDPIFFYPPYNKTFAEMTIEEKNEISHRGKSLKKLLEFFDENCEK